MPFLMYLIREFEISKLIRLLYTFILWPCQCCDFFLIRSLRDLLHYLVINLFIRSDHCYSFIRWMVRSDQKWEDLINRSSCQITMFLGITKFQKNSKSAQNENVTFLGVTKCCECWFLKFWACFDDFWRFFIIFYVKKMTFLPLLKIVKPLQRFWSI